jgi:hypothetical protein
MYLLRQINLIILAGFLLFTSSCKRTGADSPAYFNIDSLIHAQARHLTDLKASLTKKAQIDGAEETLSFIPGDTALWLKELDIFATVSSINKPVNKGNYSIIEGTDDDRTNLTVRTFTSKVSLPVVWLKVYYQDEPQHIRRIEALCKEESSLIKGSKMLIMEFQELNNKITLITYSLEGGQVMFLSKPVEFTLIGNITAYEWQGTHVNH